MAAVNFNTKVDAPSAPGRNRLPSYDEYMKSASGANPLSSILSAYQGYKQDEAMKAAIADPSNANTDWLNQEQALKVKALQDKAVQDAQNAKKFGWLEAEQGRQDEQRKALEKYNFDPLASKTAEIDRMSKQLQDEYAARGGTGVARDNIFSDKESGKISSTFTGLQPTQEEVYNSNYKKMLEIYKDPAKAKTAASQLAAGFTSEKDLVAREKAATEQLNEVNKNKADQAKEAYKLSLDRAKVLDSRVKKRSSSSKNGGKLTQFEAIKEIEGMELDNWFSLLDTDTNSAKDSLAYGISQGLSPSQAMTIIQNNVQRGGTFTDDKTFENKIRQQLKDKADSGGSYSQYSKLPPLDLKAMQYDTAVSRDLNEIKYDQGEGKLAKLLGSNGVITPKKTTSKASTVIAPKQPVTKSSTVVSKPVTAREILDAPDKGLVDGVSNTAPIAPTTENLKKIEDAQTKVKDTLTGSEKAKKLDALKKSFGTNTGLMSEQSKKEFEVLSDAISKYGIDPTVKSAGYLYDLYQRSIGQPFLNQVYNPIREGLIRATH